MNAKGALSLGMLLLFTAILIPVGINTFNSGNEIARSERFTAPATITEDYVISLTYSPVKSGSDVVFIDDATATRDSDYTINTTTGLITVASASLDGNDAILIRYTEAVNMGPAGALWVFIPSIALLFVAYNFYRSRTPKAGGF